MSRREHRAMKRGAHAGLCEARDVARTPSEAIQTAPRLASVRSLYVLQQERRAKRERVSRLIVCGLFPALFLAAFVYYTGGF